MYTPPFFTWFFFAILVCVAVSIICLIVKPQKKKLAGILILSAMGLVFILISLDMLDRGRLRRELKSMAPSRVTQMKISWTGSSEIRNLNPQETERLLLFLQLVEYIAAHHSHPIHEFDLSFQYEGNDYRYRLGQDSERSDEFWVIHRKTDVNFGRINSTEFGPFVHGLLRKKGDQSKEESGGWEEPGVPPTHGN